MSTGRRLVAVLAGSASAGALVAAPAMAAPVNSPQAETIQASCPGGNVAIVPAPGNGDWTPGFIVGTHRVVIPYRFVFTVRDASGAVVESDTQAKSAPIPRGAITCTFAETFTEDGQTFTFTGTVTGVVRGKP
jgi:hypothetical protein